MWRRRRRRRCDSDDDGVGGGGGCGGGEGDGNSDGGCGGGGCVGVRAGGGALELMAGRGYAIWGMQFFLSSYAFRAGQNLHAYTVPKFAYLVRDKKGTQNRVGYSTKVTSRHDLRPVLLQKKRRYLDGGQYLIFGRYFCPSSKYRPNITFAARVDFRWGKTTNW